MSNHCKVSSSSTKDHTPTQTEITITSEFVTNSNIQSLNEEDKQSCEGLVSVEECEKMLKTFQNNKTPGNDGLSKEFLAFFWEEVKLILVESFNCSFHAGELSTSQKQAIITLIDKKGKDRLQIKNWRPLSLLNVDYKIVSKVVANRMQNVLPKLIHYNQSGFIKDRFIGDTIRTILDIIDYTDKYNKQGLLMMIDFEKAYDSVEWPFLFKVLEQCNFGPTFIKWIKTLYTGIESCVSNGGNSSSYFKVTKGMRQGDPLSSYLFVLVVEMLAIAIRNNTKIHGLEIANHNIKILQYADDTTAVLSDLQSATEFIEMLNRFKIISGLNINIEKTEAIWLGAFKNRKDSPLGIKWSKEPVKILGIYICNDQEEAIEWNFKKRLKQVQTTLSRWKCRDLSLTGKVLIIKCYAVSQFLYIAHLLPFPKHRIKEFEREIYAFLWNGKTHKVKMNTVIQDYCKGGQTMPDLHSIIISQKLKWVKMYLNNHICSWVYTMRALIEVENLSLLLQSNFNIHQLENLTPFYREVLEAVARIHFIDSKTNKGISNQFIFYNKNIKIGKKMLYNKNLFEAGLWRVKDLFNRANNVIPFRELQRRGILEKNYIMWRGILNVVHQKWKNNITHEEPDVLFTIYVFYIMIKKLTY